MSTSYEEQLELVRNLKRSTAPDLRQIAWGETRGTVGIARNPHGQIEVFLAGPELHARSRRVRDALAYQRWYRAGGSELLANRILLPAAGHFEQVAAFLVTELLRSGAVDDLERSFEKTEPLIELAIEDLLLADEAFVGLCGELLVLRALTREVEDQRVPRLIACWKGFRDTARDIQLADVGIEVKTTTGSASSHHYSGVHQLEVGHGVDGINETAFFLTSIGLEWAAEHERGNTTSLPEVLDAILARVDTSLGHSGAAVAEGLVAQVARYGGPTRLGYNHRTMSGDARFKRRFQTTFCRSYDLADDAIRLISSDDLRARPFIETDSLRLRVNLPNQVRGDVNPVKGLSDFAQHVLATAGDRWA